MILIFTFTIFIKQTTPFMYSIDLFIMKSLRILPTTGNMAKQVLKTTNDSLRKKRLQNNKGYDLFDRNDIRQVFFCFLGKAKLFLDCFKNALVERKLLL